MVTIIDGKKIAKNIEHDIKEYISYKKIRPSLHIIYIGSDSVIDNFIEYKKKFGANVGADVVVHRLNEKISESAVVQYITNHTADADGVIIQLPIPDHLDRQNILNIVPVEKDIDVLSNETRKLFINKSTSFFPPVTGAIAVIANKYHIDFSSTHTLIIGDGMLVGYPTMLWMDRESYKYTLVNKQTDPVVMRQCMHEADIIISGVGQPHMIKDTFIKEDIIIFDAGTSESGKKILGDVHPDTYKKLSLVTPVPGGIGPLTIALLYYNLMHATYSDYDRNINTNSF